MVYIEDFFKQNIISARAYNSCRSNNIETISELKLYFIAYGEFISFKNCGEKTNKELIDFCFVYFKNKNHAYYSTGENSNYILFKKVNKFNSFQVNIINNIIITKSSTLSIKVNRRIKEYLSNCIDIEGFINYFLNDDYLDFINYKKTGDIIIEEVRSYLLFIRNYIIKIHEHSDESLLELNSNDDLAGQKSRFFLDLNPLQERIVDEYIELISKNKLGRNYNRVRRFLGGDPNLKSLINKIYSKENIINRKKTSFIETSLSGMTEYINDVKDFAIEVSEVFDEKELIILKNKYLYKNEYIGINISDFLRNSKSIFKLIDFLIDNFYLLGNFETFIFKKTHKIYNDLSVIKVENIASEIGFNKNRVIQIRDTLINKIYPRILYLRNYANHIIQDIKLEDNPSIIFIDCKKEKEINFLDKTHFSNQFITYVLSILLEDNFSIIGKKSEFFIVNATNLKSINNWNNNYLVRKDFSIAFDFESMIEDLNKRLASSSDEVDVYNLRIYISQFIINNQILYSEELLIVCQTILIEEFNIQPNIDNEISLSKNHYLKKKSFSQSINDKKGEVGNLKDIINKSTIPNQTSMQFPEE